MRLRLPLLVLAAAVILAVPVALAAAPHGAQPGQKIDLKVLLISADGTESTYEAWKAQLDREGVPYDTFVAYSGATKAATLTDAQLADYGDNHAKYQAVILSTGDLGHNVGLPPTTSYLSALTDAEWATLAKFERTFGIRQMSDYTAPTPAHGLNTVGGAITDGLVGTLTPTGKAAFPYLKGSVPIANDDPVAAETFGYQATPVNAANWQTLLAGPNNTAYLGIYTHPDDGREEMVYTVASNQYQSHNQLLRHGMLNWVTRGVFLGYQRNYLELDVDDIFLGDDKWNATTNVTDYDFANAIRMTPADVTNAVAWQNATGLKMNMVYNMGGVDLYTVPPADPAAEPLLAAFRTNKNQFRWTNHTLEHPNLDCTTADFTSNQLTQNQTRFNSLLGPVNGGLNDPTEAVTGEHSGLANVRPGNPGTIDPPSFDDLTATTGTLALGTYDYAITATSPAGETIASIATTEALPAASGVVASFNAVCHATSFNLYRAPTGTTTWVKVGTLLRPDPRAPVDNGTAPLVLSITDTGATDTAGAPPASNGAALAPYTQNPSYVPALTAAGIRTVASDSSKPYPNPPEKPLPLSEGDLTNFPKGAPFPLSPTIQAVPRYPSNVYYNVANRADQLDEYNWIYVSPPLGNCVPILNVTTCRTTLATWAEYVNSENTIMFRHLMDNDPRPHYFHQTNIAGYNSALPETDLTNGGILYGVVGPLLQRYDAYFDRTSEPLLQLSQTQIGQTLTQQSTWAANRASGKVSAWLQDGRIHVKNSATAPIDVPLTGTTVGGLYGGQKSGWTSIAAGGEQVFAPNDPANTAAPTVSGSEKVGSTLTAGKGAWSGTPTIQYDYQWRRCNAQGNSCSNLAGATGATYEVTAADVHNTLRVVVSAGNWISSVSQAASNATDAVPEPPKPSKSTGGPGSGPSDPSAGGTLGARSASLALTKLRMSPRRFAVSHRRKQKGTRLDGSRITWKLNKAAKVRLTFQRLAGPKNHRRWVTVGKLSRSAKAGTGVVRFTGRFGKRLLAPRSYRLVVTATKGREKSRTKRMTFKVKRG